MARASHGPRPAVRVALSAAGSASMAMPGRLAVRR
jgi:hypothetical protein